MINIPNWYMDWVLTCAQYELLMCDAPIVVYDKADTEQKNAHSQRNGRFKKEVGRKEKRAGNERAKTFPQ